MSNSSLPFVFELREEDVEYAKAHLALIHDRYKDKFTTFPKEKGWASESLHMYQGFWHRSKLIYSVETTMALQETYKAHSADIYLATLPKSGTTWMKALMFAIVNRTRNPKDVLISLFHCANKLRGESRSPMKFEEAFEMFTKDVTDYGPYWDHVKEYYNASLQCPSKILFLTYESMSSDTTNNVKRLAEFLGCPFTKEEEAESAVEEIVHLCSFKTLSEANKHGKKFLGMSKIIHFREGKVGD